MPSTPDVVVVGWGLAGLVTATELTDRGVSVALVDQEPIANLGGQAHWSFGGLFLVDSPEQRRLGIRDSLELATADWLGSAGFDRDEDHWGRQWAQAYLDFAAGEKRSWLHGLGVRFFPVVGWAERGDGRADGHGNSVPRFHITWGTGPGVVAPFVRKAQAALGSGLLTVRSRHRVEELLVHDGAVVGVRCSVLAPDGASRGEPSSRAVVGEVELRAGAVVLASGGIGANHDLVRAAWPARLGSPPARMVTGVPAYVDGSGLGVAERVGASVVNRDRMWHYVEGLHNWAPIWPGHGIRILPGPSSLWLDGAGRRLPPPLFPGYDTLGTLDHPRHTGFDHSWFVTNRSIAGKEFALSGSEQNPDLTGQSWPAVLRRSRQDMSDPVRAFVERGADIVTAPTVRELVARMHELEPAAPLDPSYLETVVAERDREVSGRFTKDAQAMAMVSARRYVGDRVTKRAFPPVALTDPRHGPMIAVRLSVLTRKTLGGLETDLSGRVLRPGGEVFPGLYAAGEVSGFGGGGVHGYRSLEGTFLGGCLHTGLRVARGLTSS